MITRCSVLLMLSLPTACAVVTPPFQHVPATAETYASLQPAEHACGREIPVLPATTPMMASYRDVGSVSVTCYPGVLGLCDRRLQDGGCRLGADAVIRAAAIDEVPPPLGASKQLLVVRSGRAIRYE